MCGICNGGHTGKAEVRGAEVVAVRVEEGGVQE